MRTAGNISEIAADGVDYVGFIFYDKSPRFAGDMPAENTGTIPCGIKKVGVFVNSSAEEIGRIVDRYGLDMVQLHGDETPGFCEEVKRFIPVMKAFSVSSPEDFQAIEKYAGTCDFFLFDTKTPGRGGSGEKFDWNLINFYTGDTPFFLSGGISPNDACAIKKLKHPALRGVDINSRFETEPGIKDALMVNSFIKNIKNTKI